MPCAPTTDRVGVPKVYTCEDDVHSDVLELCPLCPLSVRPRPPLPACRVSISPHHISPRTRLGFNGHLRRQAISQALQAII